MEWLLCCSHINYGIWVFGNEWLCVSGGLGVSLYALSPCFDAHSKSREMFVSGCVQPVGELAIEFFSSWLVTPHSGVGSDFYDSPTSSLADLVDSHDL